MVTGECGNHGASLHSLQKGYQIIDIFWWIGDAQDLFRARRVLESEPKGVQGLAGEGPHQVSSAADGLQPGGRSVTIGRVADDRMAEMGQVNSDLVSAPGFEGAFDQARRVAC